jgi:hypothetical protein
MGELLPMPKVGDVFADVRGDDRTMRVSCHEDRGVVVVSLWHGRMCRGSFQLSVDDLDRLREAVACGPDPAAGPDPVAPTSPGPAAEAS